LIHQTHSCIYPSQPSLFHQPLLPHFPLNKRPRRLPPETSPRGSCPGFGRDSLGIETRQSTNRIFQNKSRKRCHLDQRHRTAINQRHSKILNSRALLLRKTPSSARHPPHRLRLLQPLTSRPTLSHAPSTKPCAPTPIKSTSSAMISLTPTPASNRSRPLSPHF
jgi:hypothetical protein